MKNFVLIIIFAGLSFINSLAQKNLNDSTALIIIDIQEFYFPGGKAELVNPEKASQKASQILSYFRDNKMLVVHVRHNFAPGGDIHKDVQPIKDEKVISKDDVNAFKGTDLKSFLTIRISLTLFYAECKPICVWKELLGLHDLGYDCTVISDACATRNLTFGDRVIQSQDVHLSTLSTLKGTYAEVMDATTYLNRVGVEWP
ncbi:MAG: isochorismatase family protein [Bacteroidales bacterium]